MLLSETAAKAPGNAYWIADARPYELREVFDTVRQAFADEDMDATSRQPIRIPLVAAKAAEAADRFVQGRGRYVQAAHVLGELKDTIACDITRARDELGYDPPVDLLEGMRQSIRWCLANGEQV